MTAEQSIFLFIGFVILFSGYMMVTRSNLVHAALFLVVALFGVAVIFVLLDAGFLAVVQGMGTSVQKNPVFLIREDMREGPEARVGRGLEEELPEGSQ